MENYYSHSSSNSSMHPYSYLTFLNHLYTYYEKDQEKSVHKHSRFKLKTKSFKKMKVPDALYKNYIQQQSLQDISNKKKANHQKKDFASGIWKNHAQSLKKYKSQVSIRRANEKHTITPNQETRICSQDPKNIFLKKLIKAGKIPSYNRKQLQTQVLGNLNSLSKQNTWRTVTCRNIKTAQSGTRPKSRVIPRHPQTAKPGNRQAINKTYLATQFCQQIGNAFGKKIQLSEDIWQPIDLSKQAQDLKHYDRSISYKNITKVQNFIDKVHRMQDAVQDY